MFAICIQKILKFIKYVSNRTKVNLFPEFIFICNKVCYRNFTMQRGLDKVKTCFRDKGNYKHCTINKRKIILFYYSCKIICKCGRNKWYVNKINDLFNNKQLTNMQFEKHIEYQSVQKLKGNTIRTMGVLISMNSQNFLLSILCDHQSSSPYQFPSSIWKTVS